MDTSQIISVVVFVAVLTVIMTEKVHRALASLIGALVLIFAGIFTFDAAMTHLDMNTLGVLLGMMLFVSVVKLSGVFEFLAIKCAQIAKGDPWRIMMLLMILTAVLSAFLDNVTTVLLIGPMTLTLCHLMKIDPIPFFLAEIFSSNIGGTATLIGDPPNIMIGSSAGFSFFDFIYYDAPVVVVIMVVVCAIFYVIYGRKLERNEAAVQSIMEFDAKSKIKDTRLLKISVVMVVFVVAGFMLHGALHVDSSVVALTAAALILLLSGSRIEDALLDVEWTTLGFFACLFVVVGAMTETGVIDMMAHAIIDVTGGNVFLTMLVLLFTSAVISAFLDNIPFVATMIPILLAMEASGMEVLPLWWAVSLGACLGGNGSIIGASANVVLTDIAKRNGHDITFMYFLKVGFPLMLVTIAISAVYLILRFPPV